MFTWDDRDAFAFARGQLLPDGEGSSDTDALAFVRDLHVTHVIFNIQTLTS